MEDLSAVGHGFVGRSGWLPTKETYQIRRKYRNEEASVEYAPNMSRKTCERSPKSPHEDYLTGHVQAFLYQFGSNPPECVTRVAVALPQVVQGLGS